MLDLLILYWFFKNNEINVTTILMFGLASVLGKIIGKIIAKKLLNYRKTRR